MRSGDASLHPDQIIFNKLDMAKIPKGAVSAHDSVTNIKSTGIISQRMKFGKD